MSTLTSQEIVDALDQASEAAAIAALGRRILKTTILEGHDAIIKAYTRKLREVPLSDMDLDLGVIYHVTRQRDALAAKA